MAKVVIAGTCDCPYYARIELLADKLARNLPNFVVTKIVKKPTEWKEFTQWINKKHGWIVDKSPIVWRELVDIGGKGTLIGGANEFQEYVAAYYNEYSTMTTEEMQDVAEDNIAFKAADEEDERIAKEEKIPPTKVVVIGAGSPPAKHLLTYIATHGIFGPDEFIALHLYDESDNKHIVQETRDALEEMISPMLEEIKVVDDLVDSLPDARQIIILDVVPRMQLGIEEINNAQIKPGSAPADMRKFESRDHWLRRRHTFFTAIGMLIKTYCPASVRVLVTGNPGLDASSSQSASPLNFDVGVLQKAAAPRVPRKQIVGLVKPIEQRIKAVLADNLEVYPQDITDVLIWGNIGGKTRIDLSRARVYRRQALDIGVAGGSWFSLPVLQVAHNLNWIHNEMAVEVFKTRSSLIEKYIGISHANAITNFLDGWWTNLSNQTNEVISMVVASEDWYGVPHGIVFSFPVLLHPNSSWSVVQDIDVSPEMAAEIELCVRDVLEDWAIVDPASLEKLSYKQKNSQEQDQQDRAAEDAEE
ncbi:unnamed protein product [Calicophoron daubneyi]|uniref:Lactate/malate dehydrogenase C-terminal domain-containing protein n=1 Tax=Calicophoron daubneyi TaxID=300641 RepID=A0AAV2T7J6_CALDB